MRTPLNLAIVIAFCVGWNIEEGQRKVQIQKCIPKIIVDRDALMVRLFVRRVPAVTPQLRDALFQLEKQDICKGIQCARNPKTDSLTTFRMFEMGLPRPKSRNREREPVSKSEAV